MKPLFPILILICASSAYGGDFTGQAAPQTQAVSSGKPADKADKQVSQTTNKARTIIDDAIQALGGQAYLSMRDRELQGRVYSFHAGRPTGAGGVFWSFTVFPDRERIELTKERDIAEVFVGDKGYEITYKGARLQEKKDLDDYLRRRHYSLDAVLRNWVNQPGVILLLEGNAIAAQHEAYQVTVINAQNESVSLYFDTETHLPVKKTFEWRDPVDKQKNLEEEVYENYRPISGIMAPFNITRFFNGDMSNQRFMNSVSINQDPDPDMFNPNSGYKPDVDEKNKKKH
jgi:hypothetical protein